MRRALRPTPSSGVLNKCWRIIWRSRFERGSARPLSWRDDCLPSDSRLVAFRGAWCVRIRWPCWSPTRWRSVSKPDSTRPRFLSSSGLGKLGGLASVGVCSSLWVPDVGSEDGGARGCMDHRRAKPGTAGEKSTDEAVLELAAMCESAVLVLWPSLDRADCSAPVSWSWDTRRE